MQDHGVIRGLKPLENLRVLIAYASRFGSTSEISQEIGDILRKEDLNVDLIDLKGDSGKNPNLSDYEGILVGSGIRMGRWTKEDLSFLKKNCKELSQKNLGPFVSSGEAANPEKYDQAKKKYLEDVIRKIGLMQTDVLIEAFGGVFDLSTSNNYSFFEKKMIKRIATSSAGFVVQDGKMNDFRNWQLIREWATSFADRMKTRNNKII
jgi:menaquinone-dependent protoporphyrinogen oxidase